jgi:hypothetical protein
VQGRSRPFNELFKEYRDEKVNVAATSLNQRHMSDSSDTNDLALLNKSALLDENHFSPIKEAIKTPTIRVKKQSKKLEANNSSTATNKSSPPQPSQVMNTPISNNPTDDSFKLNASFPYESTAFNAVNQYQPQTSNPSSINFTDPNNHQLFQPINFNQSNRFNDINNMTGVNMNNNTINEAYACSVVASAAPNIRPIPVVNNNNPMTATRQRQMSASNNNMHHLVTNQQSPSLEPIQHHPMQHQPQPMSMYNNLNQFIAKLNLNYANVQLVKHHPRPSAVTTFNARLTDYGGGYALWNRRQDNLRHVLSQCFMQNEKFLRKNPGFIHSNESSSFVSTTAPVSLNQNSKMAPNLKSAFIDANRLKSGNNVSSHNLDSYGN